MANIKKIFSLLSKIGNLKLWIVLLIFLAILGSLFGLGMGHGLRLMIEFSTEGNWQIAQTGLILFVLVLIFENIFRIIRPLILSKFEQETQIKMRTRLVCWALQNYMILPEHNEKGNYIEAVTNDVKKITKLITKIINSCIKYPITATITIIYLIWTSNFLMMLFGIVASILSGYISKRISKSLTEISRTEREKVGKFTQFIKELFSIIELWKLEDDVFNWAVEKNRTINQDIKKFRRQQSKFLSISNLFQVDVADTLTRILVMVVGSYLVFKDAVTVGDLAAFIFLFHRVVRPFQNMFDFLNKLNAQMGTVEKVSYYLDSIRENTINSHVSFLLPNMKLEQLKIEKLKINVQGKPLLQVKNLVLKKGTITIVKGENGSGKTTFVNTLLGHHKEFSGFIMADEKVIELDESKSYFTIAEQESFVFSSSIKENIIFGDKDINKLNEVIENTGFNKVLGDLEMGLYDKINNNLSSGQKKLISLSRAFYRKTPILIFDEPTESLDKNNIELYKKNLNRLKKDHILIIITHHQELLSIADKLLVIKNKKLIEVNTGDKKNV